MIAVRRSDLPYERSWDKEWIVTNGLGSYASSTVTGANTRKYHGLLVASQNPPVDRRLLVSKFEETARVGGRDYPLSTNKYPDVVFPNGCANLESFSLSPFPTFSYSLGGATVKKTVFMVNMRNITVVRYVVSGNPDISLSIRVLVNDRDFHSNTLSEFPLEQRAYPNKVFVRGPSSRIIVESDLATYESSPCWYKNMAYEFEKRRGTGELDDHFSPGIFRANGRGNFVFHLAATDGFMIENPFPVLYNDELKRLKTLMDNFYLNSKLRRSDFLNYIANSASSFVVQRKSTNSKSIIAGYHWFSDWARDSMISLPGLSLATGRFSDAREILTTFSKYCREGLLPNAFPDSGGEPSYNSADAPLLFINAIHKYVSYTRDYDFVKGRLYPAAKEIIQNYREGTRFKIGMASDSLVSVGPQLTWMDATVGGVPVTPRDGKPVEINALWYNALCTMEALAHRFSEKEYAGELKSLHYNVHRSFSKFWNPSENCLFDTIDQTNSSVRPNQIFAVSLPFSPLPKERQKAVVDKCARELYARFGLRTLSPRDKAYRPFYKGGPSERDSAYHQGAVWPWLIGPFIDAQVRVYNSDITNLVSPFSESMNEAGLGSISEIYEADSLRPDGCISQAWSVAELLRILAEHRNLINFSAFE